MKVLFQNKNKKVMKGIDQVLVEPVMLKPASFVSTAVTLTG